MSGLLIQLDNKNANADGLLNANNYFDDPMLSLGGSLALFDYANEKCWPQPSGAPQQKLLNLVQNVTIPHLLLGDTDAVESTDPQYLNGFVIDAAQNQKLTAPNNSAFAFTNQSWFITCWVIFPTAAAALTGPRTIFAKGGGARAFSLYTNAFGSLIGEVAIGAGNGSLISASASVPFVIGQKYQLGLSCEIRATGLTLGIFVNGVRVASLNNSAIAITDLAFPLTIGQMFGNALPSTLIFLRFYSEILSISGRTADERIGYEYKKLKDLI